MINESRHAPIQVRICKAPESKRVVKLLTVTTHSAWYSFTNWRDSDAICAWDAGASTAGGGHCLSADFEVKSSSVEARNHLSQVEVCRNYEHVVVEHGRQTAEQTLFLNILDVLLLVIGLLSIMSHLSHTMMPNADIMRMQR